MESYDWADEIEMAEVRYNLIPTPIIRSRAISPQAKLVIAELMREAKIHGESDECSIKSGDLAVLLNVHRSRIAAAIKELLEVGLLVEHKKNGYFKLFPKMRMTYELLFKLWPTKIDHKPTRQKLMDLMSQDPRLINKIPLFFGKECRENATFSTKNVAKTLHLVAKTRHSGTPKNDESAGNAREFTHFDPAPNKKDKTRILRAPDGDALPLENIG